VRRIWAIRLPVRSLLVEFWCGGRRRMEPYGVAGFKLLISEIIFATPKRLAEPLRHSDAKRGLRIPFSPPDSKAVTSPNRRKSLYQTIP
jgi:hypothetical protein